jgi:collagenase-like PrtC family protease
VTAAAAAPRKPELVCPAGNRRALTVAVDAGADAGTLVPRVLRRDRGGDHT